ncbi:pyridine nucleotide-disulfide oxidoreductase/dicluster-binding protein [Desulfonatronum sp. SC1]|uniref:pyridine nucleotide-disulfide oxidoreductase/dicluster-binding protein n=1 Tax=Desulfonatronum sp. SC1 TaxID=2109626 RepID=UPI000D30E5DD|nr:pyridine nucleotide-disulfide oxidoreductase/dicluster-binding protein [Desulfonatronum sp. SC1]PTN37922.1 4Fe-4S ferredoxin [Desulfonatronum sp. SC1]
MEQHELRAWENKCIQEEPPYCQAACPLHVDVRSMARLMAENRLAEARKVLERTMPLSEIFARICDHPCQAPCRRGDVDEVIRIGALERALVEAVPSTSRQLLLPSKGRRVMLFGSGPSSLVAAHDLRRKGIEVTLKHGGAILGGVLCNLPETLLSVQALEAGLEMLRSLGVVFEADPDMGLDTLEAAVLQVDAIYVGLDDPWTTWARELAQTADPVSLATSRDRIFAGGIVQNFIDYSPIFLALAGRKAVLSMERLFQGASLTAGREKEGPHPTRLFTSIDGIESSAAEPMADPARYSGEEAVHEARRCLLCECMECVKACVFMEHYKGYPKKLAREIYNNLSVVQGMRQANRMILSCSNCGLCAAICPHDFHMGEFCMTARKEMVHTNKMPGSAHDFALREQAAALSDEEFLVSHEPEKTSSTYCFFPGCQLAGSSPEHVRFVLDHLRDSLSGGVGVLLTCCGAPAQWAARRDLLNGAVDRIRQAWEELGRPKMILGCTTCRRVLSKTAPEIPTRSLWETLVEQGLPGTAKPASSPLALHDPCTSRDQNDVRAAVRTILHALEQPFVEPRLGGELTECCGFGGLMDAANPALAEKVARTRTERTPEHFLAYCAMCRDSLSRSAKPVFHLLDLLFPDSLDAAQPAGATPMIRKGPNLPDRRQNRARLKERLSGTPLQPKAHQKLFLLLEPDARTVVDHRRILDDDLHRVVHAAETDKRRFTDPKTGRLLASRRIGHATFWVEYEPLDELPDTYRVHRAWMHRMVVKEES